MASRPKRADYHEGPEAAWRFEHAMHRLIRVPKEELDRREAEYNESRRSQAKPGPKPRKTSRTGIYHRMPAAQA